MSQRLSRAQIARELDWASGGGGDLSMWAWAPKVLILPRGSSVPSTPEPKPGWHAWHPARCFRNPEGPGPEGGDTAVCPRGLETALCQWGLVVRAPPSPMV